MVSGRWLAARFAALDYGLEKGHSKIMTVEQIKEEVSNLPEAQQDQVVACVMHLRYMREPSARQELSRRMADRDPAHRISFDQLREHWKD